MLFRSEIRTHYPIELADEMAVISQEADLVAEVPEALLEILARYTRLLRESPAVDQRSGVSARFSIAGAETTAAAALRRATVYREDTAVARLVDIDAAVDVLAGKIEFEAGEEGREQAVLDHLLRRATAETLAARLRGVDLDPLIEALDGTVTVTTGADIPAHELLEELPELPEESQDLYDRIAQAFGAESAGERAAAVELALEWLFLAQKISKDADDDGTIYG